MAARDVQRRLGQRIQELRIGAGLTQESLAVRAGITWHFVSAIERGVKSATLDTLLAIAAALDVSLSELVLGVDRPLPRGAQRLSTVLAGRDAEVQLMILRVVEESLALVDTRSAPVGGGVLRAAERGRASRSRR